MKMAGSVNRIVSLLARTTDGARRSCGTPINLQSLRRNYVGFSERCMITPGSSAAVLCGPRETRRYKAKAKTTFRADVLPEQPRGWEPETSMLHENLNNEESVVEEGNAAITTSIGEESNEILWTPTGTGGYPMDWNDIMDIKWDPQSTMRCGALGVKLGMCHTWDAWGWKTPLTAIQLQDNEVLDVVTPNDEGRGVYALVVGAVNRKKTRRVHRSQLATFRKRGIPVKRYVRQFKVSPDALMGIKSRIQVDHFVPGQFVDVIAKTKGKGFQGVMKRHGMKGGNASHGTTKSHRKMGATGGGQDPGRVWPGKRMPGHMGQKNVITHSLQAYKIDTRWNILYVKGCVPGAVGSVVAISDARRKLPECALPVPTAADGVVPYGFHVAPPSPRDPNTIMRRY
eukprot:m.341941 g.341941  ORF g.341941 m.341941 type:complete len:399 (+) comp20620_c0_seq1:137-1333(+)